MLRVRLNEVVGDITAGKLEGFTAFMASIEVENPLPLAPVGGACVVQVAECSRGRSGNTIKIGAGFAVAGQLDSSSKSRWESSGTSPASIRHRVVVEIAFRCNLHTKLSQLVLLLFVFFILQESLLSTIAGPALWEMKGA